MTIMLFNIVIIMTRTQFFYLVTILYWTFSHVTADYELIKHIKYQSKEEWVVLFKKAKFDY